MVAQERGPLTVPGQLGQLAQRRGDRAPVPPRQRQHQGLVEAEREHHQHPGSGAVRLPEVVGQLLVGDIGLRQEHRISPVPGKRLAQVPQEAEVVPAAWPGLGLDQERRGVQPEAGHPEPEPEHGDLLYLLADRRVVGVEVGLEPVEPVPVPRVRYFVPGPLLVLHAGKHHSLEPVRGLGLRPHVPVTERRVRIGARGSEPRMLVAGVIDHEVQHDPDAPLTGLVQQRLEVAHLAEPRVHAEIVGDVVAAVLARRRLDWVQPDRGDTQPGQVVEPAHHPAEVAHPVVVAVLEQADVDRVDNTGPVPAGQHMHLPAMAGKGC